MGDNLPPGVTVSDIEAAWGDPQPEADTSTRPPECVVCHKPVEQTDSRDLTFCESHDQEDYQVKLEHDEQRRRERFEADTSNPPSP